MKGPMCVQGRSIRRWKKRREIDSGGWVNGPRSTGTRHKGLILAAATRYRGSDPRKGERSSESTDTDSLRSIKQSYMSVWTVRCAVHDTEYIAHPVMRLPPNSVPPFEMSSNA